MTETEKRQDRVGFIARQWWRELHDQADGGADKERTRRPDRAALAELRRCDGAGDAMTVSAFSVLLGRLYQAGHLRPWPRVAPDRITFRDDDIDRAATIAIVLSGVREDVQGRVARQLGPKGGDDDAAPMSPSRFQRLLQTRPGEELTRAMIRVVHLLDRTANVDDLAQSIWAWQIDATRTSWAFLYFNAAQADPARRLDPPPPSS